MVSYLRAMCELVLEQTNLLPHANPGILSREELAELGEVNASMGLMLENVSTRLTAPGGPHWKCAGKVPRARLDTIAYAGEMRVPFTTGLLIGPRSGSTPSSPSKSFTPVTATSKRSSSRTSGSRRTQPCEAGGSRRC
jgi:7,8-didemethyl-8-hydroxy-5-deazariboflavin synthase CofG subunit